MDENKKCNEIRRTSKEGMECKVLFFFQGEGGIRNFWLSRGIGDVYKGQGIVIFRIRSSSARPGGGNGHFVKDS